MATAADFNTAAADVRTALAEGGRLNGQQMLRILSCLQAFDGAGLATALATQHTDVGTLNTDYTAQMAILSAFTGADLAATIVAAIATAKAALDPDVAAVVADDTATQAVTVVNVTVAANAVADGGPLAGSY